MPNNLSKNDQADYNDCNRVHHFNNKVLVALIKDFSVSKKKISYSISMIMAKKFLT